MLTIICMLILKKLCLTGLHNYYKKVSFMKNGCFKCLSV